ncbi:DNA-binding protein [Limosilactobacillus antri]|uniref:DNA-binding protein n=1 Tax=Limosilactobacillus antri TaxID=227943 RepID=UPI001F590A3A|nr:DNA-binding protein [Limosilactobacillus antri]
MNAEEKYQAELKQSDLDHHQPTAAAMTGHIISNLLIHSLKISQANLFAKGSASLFLAEKATGWVAYERQEIDQLNHLLVNNGESIPTITTQFREYTMLEENGSSKYLAGEEQLFALVRDFDTQILFITKAIALAKNESWPELSANLISLLVWIKEQIRVTQDFLGHELKEGLYVEDDDDF